MTIRRLKALNELRDELEETRVAIRIEIRSASAADKRKLLKSLGQTRRSLEQSRIEIGLLEDAGELVRRYTELQRDALDNAEAARTPSRRTAFEERAELCALVVEDAIEQKTKLKPITDRQLATALGELAKAAQEAKDTVDSINNAIGIANKVLDGLILLARVAAKLAV